MTRAEQFQTLIEDLARAEKAGLVVKGNEYAVDENYVGEFSVVDVEVASDILAELLDYLRQSYPDIRFCQINWRTVYYDLR